MNTLRPTPMTRTLPLLLAFLAVPMIPPPRDGAAGPAAAASGDVGSILDREGAAARRPVLADRWGPADEHGHLAPGDWLKTGARGANALRIKLTSGTELTLGPATRIEVTDADHVTLVDGELEVIPAADRPLELAGPKSTRMTLTGRAVLRAGDGALTRLDPEPRWLTGYRNNASTEALGSLLATIDGRNVPLTMGYHQVTVDVRDQIARTVIEESFINHTASVLEGVFYFPLPGDASISGFGMWIGDELVEGEIVEKQRAREIYETILREKRDPGLLEWAGGNVFKARVYPIGGEKRIRISYTQVLQKRGDEYTWNYALQSDLLRQHPLSRLRIQIDVSSAEPLAAVESTTHECRVRTTEHAAHVEFEADEYTPDRDFELRVKTASAAAPVTLVPHRRGDDGYFMLLINPPALDTTSVAPAAPLDLLVMADTSGSMAGPQRETQLAFVEALLASLGDRDRFNLLTCDVETHLAFEQPVDNTPARREQALRFLEQREPLGWTNLDAAFRQACDLARAGSQVVYVGDGAPTAGDPDPVGFAHRLERLYRGQGTFHVVVPGATGEPMVWNAIAALGQGSVRSITGGIDAATAAFELLGEITAPAIHDLRVGFDGIQVAAVYPDRLPNLAQGRQQIVVGRFDPLAGDVAGRITVRGSFAGKPVEMATDVSIAANDAGNSFLPRLWARRHLDHLLGQGSARDVRERVIALSEEFQILTPYTSFLVLESDADRERFQVEKRLRMRDGEEFFAAGRDAARFELTRDQMQKARSWRLRLQAAAFDTLSQMAREQTERLGWASTNMAVGQSGVGARLASAPRGGFARDESGPAESLAEDQWSAEGKDKNEPIVDGDAAEDAERDDALPAEELAGPAPSPAAKEVSNEVARQVLPAARARLEKRAQDGPAVPGGGFLDQLGYLGAAGGRRGGYMPPSPFAALFPQVPEPGPRPDVSATRWPQDVRDLLLALDRRGMIADGTGGLDIVVETTSRDARNRSWRADGRHLLGASSWLQLAAHGEGGDYTVAWTRDGRRGILTEAFRLGRTRAATAADATDYAGPLPWSFGEALAAYVDYDATSEPLGDGQVRVVLTHASRPDASFTLIVDRERALVVEALWTEAGKAGTRQRFGDLVQIGGAWWPTSIRVVDADGHETSSSAIRIASIDASELAVRIAAQLDQRADAILLDGPEPDIALSRAAAQTGDATLEQSWALFLHFANDQRFDEAAPYFQAIADRCQDKPGMLALRATLLQQTRRNEELKQLVMNAAAALSQQPRDAELDVAARLFAFAAGTNPGNEQLALLDVLQPIYLRHGDIPDVALTWERWRLSALQAMDRPDEVLAQWEHMARSWRFAADIQVGYARELAQRGEIDAALTRLAAAAKDGPWNTYELAQFRSATLDVLWNGYRLEQLVETVAGWLRDPPDAADALDSQTCGRYLAALTFLDREAQAWELARSWFELSGQPKVTPAERNRLQAAVQYAVSGGGYFYYDYNYRLDDDRLRALTDGARRMAHRDDLCDIANQILFDWRYRQTDPARALGSELFAELQRTVDKLPAARLNIWMSWLANDLLGPVAAPARDAIFERVYARWQGSVDPAEKNTLGQIVTAYGGVELKVRYHRHVLETAADATARAAATLGLMNMLQTLPWTQPIEDELFALIPGLALPETASADDRSHNLDQRILALYRLTTWLPEARREATVAALPDVNLMPRRILKTAREDALKDARNAVIDRLAGLSQRLANDPLGEFAKLERLYLMAKVGRDLEQVRTTARQIAASHLDAKPADDPPLRDAIATQRAIGTLAWLLAREASASASAAEADLLALLDRAVAGNSPLLDGRQWRYLILLALDRSDALLAALRSWYASEDARLRERFGPDLAYVLAERGELAQAIDTLRAIEQHAELDSTDYATLADWHTALGDADAAREARIRAFATLPEYELSNRLWRDVNVYQRGGDEPPPDLDPNIPLRFIALFRKATHPTGYFGQLQAFYNPTKDFRLLQCLPDAVIGHSAQGVYPFLEQTRSLFASIQEEATLDRMTLEFAALRTGELTPIDRRALLMLEFLTESAAADQHNGAERHLEAALTALREANRGSWADGEPLLMARFLANRHDPAPVAQEVLRLLRALVGVAGNPADRLAVSQQLATALWQYDRRDEALRTLEGALATLRNSSDGRLPLHANEALVSYAGWLEAVGEHRKVEALWAGELESRQPEQQRLWLVEQQHGLYRNAVIANADLALGRDKALYQAVVASFLRDLTTRTNEQHASDMIATLCDLWNRLDRSAHDDVSAADASRFAFAELPAILDLYQYRSGQGVVGNVAQCLRQRVGHEVEVEFLVIRAENEPRWLRLQGQDFWPQHAWRLGEARRNAGSLDDSLTTRLLAVVLKELRADLSSGHARQRSMYEMNNNASWTARREDFRRAALAVLEDRRDSGLIVRHIASYLFHGLEAHDDAIDALLDANRRGILDLAGRRDLCTFLQLRERWQESIAPLDALIGDQPDAADLRVMRMRAAFRTGDAAGLTATLAAADAWFREHQLWQESVIATLGSGAMETGLHVQAIALLDEAIALHVKSAPNRGVGDGTLSAYYRDKASALAGLGRIDEAVDAAAGAIVSTGGNDWQRTADLQRLRDILAQATDLDAYVMRLDDQVRSSGLENPIVRKALGQVYLDQRRYAEAAAQLRLAIDAAQTDDENHALLVTAYDKLKQPELAVAAQLAHARLVAREAAPYMDVAQRYAALGRAESAERARTSAVEALPEETDGYVQLALVREAAGRHADAADLWRQVARIRENEPTGQLGLLRCLLALERTEEAAAVRAKLITTRWPERFGDVAAEARSMRP